MEYSVLMSVYYKEKPKFLEASINSIFNQTVRTNDFVIVCDGQLGDDLYEILDNIKSKYCDILNIVKLDKNVGLGEALNHGMKYCKNELVARMDSDDIAQPYRCEKQLEAFSRYERLDIVGGTVEEFTVKPEETTGKRVLPEEHAEILAFSKKRNPFNHPCVMFKKSSVIAAGSYKDFYLLEDYYLWVRMLLAGSIGHNIQEPLLYMRTGEGMYLRRSGTKYLKSLFNLYLFMYKEKHITLIQFVQVIAIRSVVVLIPNSLRKVFYVKFLRSNV